MQNDATDTSQAEDAVSIAATERYLELVIRNSVDAINHRDFQTNSPRWAGFSIHFKMKTHAEGFQNALEPDRRALPARPLHEMSFGEFLAHQRNISLACPGYSVRIRELNTVEVNEKGDYAEVMLEADTMGIPEGMVRPSIVTFRFRKPKGKWECVTTESIAGTPSTGL